MLKQNRIWIYVFLLPTVTVLGVLYLVPTATVFVTSFADWDNIGEPVFVGLSNYRELLTLDPAFFKALRNTGLNSLLAIFIHVPLGVFVALMVCRKPFGWRLARNFYILPNLISNAAWAIIYSFIFNPQIGLLNEILRSLHLIETPINWLFNSDSAYFAITLTWLFYAGFVTLITTGEILSFPEELRESARIDGATDRQIDLYIHLPMLRSIISTGLILATSSAILFFERIYFLTEGGPNNSTMTLPVIQFLNISRYRYGYANSIAVILILVGIGAIAIINRIFRIARD